MLFANMCGEKTGRGDDYTAQLGISCEFHQSSVATMKKKKRWQDARLKNRQKTTKYKPMIFLTLERE